MSNPDASMNASGLPIDVNIFAAVAKWAHNAVLSLQVNRMTSVIRELPDETLAQIGITRKDIPEYAASLLKSGG